MYYHHYLLLGGALTLLTLISSWAVPSTSANNTVETPTAYALTNSTNVTNTHISNFTNVTNFFNSSSNSGTLNNITSLQNQLSSPSLESGSVAGLKHKKSGESQNESSSLASGPQGQVGVEEEEPTKESKKNQQKTKPNEVIETENQQGNSLPSGPEGCPTKYHLDPTEQVCVKDKEKPLTPKTIQPTNNTTPTTNLTPCTPNNPSSCNKTLSQPKGVSPPCDPDNPCTQSASNTLPEYNNTNDNTNTNPTETPPPGQVAPPSGAYHPSPPRPCTVPSQTPKSSGLPPLSRPHNCPVLRVITYVIKSDEFGQASDITIKLLGPPDLSPDPGEFQGSEAGTDVIINPGIRYALSIDFPSEYSQLGYTASASTDCHGTTSENQRKICHILVHPPEEERTGVGGGSPGGPSSGNWLYVVINVEGGDKIPPDFRVHITGNNPNPSAFTGDSATGPVGKRVDLDEGSYSVGEESVTGYAVRIEGDCQGEMPVSGDIKRCTITNRSLELCNPDNPCISRPESNNSMVDTFTEANKTSAVRTGALTIQPPSGTEFISKPQSCTSGAENLSLQCLDDKTFKNTSRNKEQILSIPGSTLSLVSNLPPNIFLTVHVSNNNNLVKVVTLEGKVTKDIKLVPGSYSVQVDPIGNQPTFSGDCHDNDNNGATGTIGQFEHQKCLISLTHEVSGPSQVITNLTSSSPPQLSVPRAATLIVKVHVLNGQGGQCTASNCFRFSIIGLSYFNAPFSGSETGTVFTIQAPPSSTSYQVSDYPTPSYYRNAYNEYKSRDCSGTINVGQTKTCTITLDDKEMRASLIFRVHYVHDTVAHRASDATINVKLGWSYPERTSIQVCCPAPERLTGHMMVGGILPPFRIDAAEFNGQESGTEINVWSMDFAQPNSALGALYLSIRADPSRFSEEAYRHSISCVNETTSFGSKVSLLAGETKECTFTINDRP